MPNTEIRPGQEEHERLVQVWEKNGRSASFDEIGEFGGRLWQVIDRDNPEGPTFLLDAAAGPTDAGNDKPVEWMPRRGYEIEMVKKPGLQVIELGDGAFRLKMRKFPKDTDV
jgi:hypothetical protein